MTLDNPVTRAIFSIAALGVAGYLGVTFSTGAPAPPPAPQTSPAAVAGQPPPTDHSAEEVAQGVANIAVGNGALAALDGGDGQATSANCDPGTVSNPPEVSAPTSASCDITYSDGSIWQQTVTITFDSQGNPVADSTNAGTELVQPAGG
jgi:hypothetical protein